MPPRLLFCLIACLPWMAQAAPAPNVLVSIKPLHSIVAGVMQGVAKPVLLVKGKRSLHGFQLAPSQRAAIAGADVIFYTDDHFEPFLVSPLKDAPKHTQAIALSTTPGLKLLPLRRGGVWDTDHHSSPIPAGEHDLHLPDGPSGMDYHIWLSPTNALAIAMHVSQILSQRYPEHRKQFEANTAQMMADLTMLDVALKAHLAPFKDQHFLLFHDATHYFEDHFGLQATGAITFEPDEPASPKRIKALRKRLANGDIACVLSEPFFNHEIVDSVTEDHKVQRAEIDPEATQIPAGAALYDTLMNNLATSLATCLQSTHITIERAPDAPPAKKVTP